MANKVYNYKIKASLREDCKDYEELNTKLSGILNCPELTQLDNNEYGCDDWAESTAICSVLAKQDWFLKNAKELIWFNGDEGDSDDPNSKDYYFEEDWLEVALKHKRRKLSNGKASQI